MISAAAVEALAYRATLYSSVYAAAGFSTSSSSWAVAPQTGRLQGGLPSVPSMPARSLLMRKLVELERLLRPVQQQEHPEEARSSKQKARAHRRAAAQAFLSSVQEAAARNDISALLLQLSTAATATSLLPAAIASQEATSSQDSITQQLQQSATTATEADAAAGGDASTSSSSRSEGPLPADLQQQQQQTAWLLPAAVTLAARQLAAAQDGRPDYAQALVELVLDRGLLEPQRAQRAVHAVLQAYADRGDHAAVLNAAARFFGIDSRTSSSSSANSSVWSSSSSSDSSGGSSSSKAPWLLIPNSCTLALLLKSAAATGDAGLLLGVWKYFGAHSYQQYDHQRQQTQHQLEPLPSSSSSSNGGGSSRGSSVVPPPVVLHALVHGGIMCDLAAAGLHPNSSYGNSGSSSSSWPGLGHIIYQADSATMEILQEVQQLHLQSAAQEQQQQQSLQLPLPPLRHAQQKAQQQQQQQQHWQQRRAPLPSPLLHPSQASQLLQYCNSTDDVDLLLLSQLYQAGGLGPQEITAWQQQQQQPSSSSVHTTDQQRLAPSGSTTTSSSSSLAAGSEAASLRLMLERLPSLTDALHPPAFPPPLRSDVARSAVDAYLRCGALSRASAVAHAAAVANPRDMQQYQLLIRGAAAAGAALPALVIVDRLREALWQTPSPRAQAAMIRALAESGASPPLGAAPSSARLWSFFSRFCTPHPEPWGALLWGLIITGDRGSRLFKTLRAALAQPYSFMAMAGFEPETLDKARSRILGQLLLGVLSAPEIGTRLSSISEVADGLLTAAYSNSGSSGSNASILPEQQLLRSLGMPGTAAAQHAASMLAAAAGSDWSSSSSSSSDDGGWFPVQPSLPGLPLHEQSLHTRRKVLLLLQIFQLLQAWGVQVNHDAALAQALQALRFCKDTEDAHQSAGLLVAILRSALNLGIQPSRLTLRALLACCKDLESRPGKTPLGLASGPGLTLDGVGYIDLYQVLSVCQQAVDQHDQQQQQEAKASSQEEDDEHLQQADVAMTLEGGGSAGRVDTSSRHGGRSSMEARQLAADLLRAWAFNATFDYVEGVRAHGPTWPLRGPAAAGAAGTVAELTAAVGA